MSRRTRSLEPSYFDSKYATDPDPWRFETSAYERSKYEATLSALTRPRYASVLEVGCSIGVLTRQLAERCDDLLAVDVAEAALKKARARNSGLGHVRFDQCRVPESWPAGRFDLILLSEVVYYLDRADVGRLVERVRDGLNPHGEVVLVHWIGETDYPLGEAAELLIDGSRAFLSVSQSIRTDAYRLDVLTNIA